MAMTFVGERSEDRERVVTDGEIRYRRVFVVESDDPTDGPLRACLTEGVPLRGSVYRVFRADGTMTEEDIGCRVIEKRAEPVSGSHTLWYVECIYSDTYDPEKPEEGGDSSPLDDDTPEVYIGYETKQKACTSTALQLSTAPGKPHLGAGAVTTAGEPFDPPPEYEVCRTTLTITYSSIVQSISALLDYQNTINILPYLGAAVDTLRVRIEMRRVYRKGFRYWRVTYNFIHDKDGWQLRVLNAGTYYIDRNDNNKIKHFLTEDDPPQPRIGLIAENGDRLNLADRPHYVPIPVYDQRNFHNLGIPVDFL